MKVRLGLFFILGLFFYLLSGVVQKEEVMRRTWVQDVAHHNLNGVLEGMQKRMADYSRQTGARYITGPAKEPDKPGHDAGIYFEDPTSTIEGNGR